MVFPHELAQIRYFILSGAFLFIFFQWYVIGVFLVAFHMTHWDEFKYEFLTFEEFLDEIIELTNIDFYDVEQVFKRYQMIHAYQNKLPPEERTYSYYNTSYSGDPRTDPEDIIRVKRLDEWDSAELNQIDHLISFVQDEWEYKSEVDVDEDLEIKEEDLDFYYDWAYQNSNLAQLFKPIKFDNNRYLLLSSFFKNNLVSASYNEERSLNASFVEEEKLAFYVWTDFRPKYWRRAKRKKF